MRNLISIVAVAILSTLIVSTSAYSQEISSLKVKLPDTFTWSQVTDESEGETYIKRWVPEGKSLEKTDWLIVEQKLIRAKKGNAKKILQKQSSLIENSCNDSTIAKSEKIQMDAVTSYATHITCGKKADTEYGFYSQQRVIVDGKNIYWVTSELRIPASEKAGKLAFKEFEEFEVFAEKQTASLNLVRESLQVCSGEVCR